MSNRSGFTLVELMAAVMITGIVTLTTVPLLLTGQRAAAQKTGEAKMAMAGDAIFEFIAGELTMAGRIVLGDHAMPIPEGDGSWQAMYTDWNEEKTHQILMVRQEAPPSEPCIGKPIYSDSFHQGADLILYIQEIEDCRMRLTVNLARGGDVVYERAEVISLLNLALRENGGIEGIMEGDGPVKVLWYQNAENTKGEESEE